MGLADAARTRLLGALRPWLAADPDELRLELGPLRCRAVARGLELGAAALDAPDSFPATVDRAAVAEVELAASLWGAPALAAVLRGVDVSLTLREPAPRKQRPDIREWISKEKKRVIASMDPQGEMLHEMIEGLVSSLEDKIASVFSSVLLNCSQVRIDDITIQVRYLDESHVLVLRATDLQFGPELVSRSSLFRGLVGSSISSAKENHLLVKCDDFEFMLKENDRTDGTASFTGLSACVKLNNLQLAAFSIHVPNACCKVSPKAIPSLMVILDITSQKEDYRIRSGRELWQIAAKKLDSSIVGRRFSVSKALRCATFWQSYVHAYVLLLSLVGYPSDKLIKKNCSTVSRNRKMLGAIRDHWVNVLELEEKIPVEAIARARRAARSKLTISQQQNKQESSKPLLVCSLMKILTPILCLWRFLLFIFWSVWRARDSGNKAHRSGGNIFPGFSHDSDMDFQLNIHLGELSLILLPIADHFTSIKWLNNGRKSCRIDLPSMHLVIRSSCLLYSAGCTTQSLFFVVGELKTFLAGVPKLLRADNSNKPSRNSSFKISEVAEDTDSKMILWSYSASMHPFSENQSDVFSHSDGSSTAVLGSGMEELWREWMVISTVYNESDVMHNEKPSVIFELKSHVIDPYKSASGFQQCRFTVGKLNLDLDYESASSTYMLHRQFMHYKQLKELNGKLPDLLNSTGACVTPTSGFGDKLRSLTQRMNIVMSDAIPENNLHIVALVAGPSIRLSFDKNNLLQNCKNKFVPLFSQMSDKSCIVLSLAYVECAMWPASLSTSLRSNSHVKESRNTFWEKAVQEPVYLAAESSARHVYPGNIVLDARFKLAGLTLLIDNIEANQQCHVFGPMSANFQLSTDRKYVHSFFVARNVLSMNLGGGIAGCIVLFYMDELFTVCQIVESMQLVALNSDLVNVKYSDDFIGRLASFCNKNTMGSTRDLGVDHIAQEASFDSHTELMVEVELELESTYIIFSASRGRLFPNPAAFVNNTINYISGSPIFEGISTQELLDMLALGAGFCIRTSSLKLLLNGQCTCIHVSFSGIQSVIIENQIECTTALSSLPYNKNQFIITECIFHLRVDPTKDRLTNEEMENESRSGRISDSWGFCYSIEIEFTEVYIGDSRIHKYLTQVNHPSKQKISMVIHDNLKIFKCKIQGGLIFLETMFLAKFVSCCKFYFWLLMDLPLWATSNIAEDSVTAVAARTDPNVRNTYTEGEVSPVSLGAHLQNEEFPFNAVKCLDIDLSRISLTLAVADESGTYQGLTLEVDANLQLLNFGMKMLFEVKHLSISTISSMPKTTHEQYRGVPAPRFRSSKSIALTSQSEIQEYLPFNEADNVTHDCDAPSSSTSSVEGSTGNTSLEFSSHKSYILSHFSTSLKIEKKELDGDSNLMCLSGDWFGMGFISGLEVSISLSSIEMISSLLAPFQGMLSSTSSQKEIQIGDTVQQEQPDNVDYTIPDGAIVAIRDLDQQMYVSVKNTGIKYQVAGAYHYSLAGEHALFRVKHHKRWRSDTPYISLLSLRAKIDEGKELALSFSQGSDLVEVSSFVDKPCSLWSTSPLGFDSFEDDEDDAKSCKVISSSSYHLVNKKNNYGIAFVDGQLEFVKKPGNPFKLKVFDEFLFSDVARLIVPNTNLDGNSYLDVEEELPSAVMARLETGASSKHITMSIDKIVCTITHEVSDTGDVFPLVQNCISDIRVVTQIYPSKTRILSSFKVSGQYYDARKDMWENLISPITSYVFFRFRFFNKDPVTRRSRTPLRFFFHLKQVDIFINELSVDVLLYLVGKLDLMGPYAVRNSAIFPNCCKIENNSRLTLVCHFQNNGDAIVPGQQSTSVFLRHLIVDDNRPHDRSAVSISLFKEGAFSTAPINISLHESGISAWRTLVSSLKDSRRFSGPFVVVKVSQNSVEGLSLSVEPLLRIYNKSDFPLELRFQRPQKANEEAAFVTVRSGDMVDESTGVFDAMDLSGGSKRALMALALGNFMLSIRPEISEHSNLSHETFVQWSEDITGEKAVRITGVIEKLNYNLRKAFNIDSMKSSFNSLSCPVSVDGQHVTDLHFLIHTLARDVPLQPTNGTRVSGRSASVALQLQREIFIYPTVQVYNFLQTDIHVLLTDSQPENIREDNFGLVGKQAMVTSGSSAYFHVNPAMFNFSVTLNSYGSKSKAANSGDWVKRMQKQTAQAQFLDLELEFVPGKFHCSLRLLRQEKGLLEVALFTRYTLQNTSDYPLRCTASDKKSLSASEAGKDNIELPPQNGCILSSMSMNSWFSKSNKLRISLHEEKGSEAFIDLEALSGFTEFFLEIHDDVLPHRMAAFGMSLQPVIYGLPVSSQVVLIVPRYVISNESATAVAVRQCLVQDDIDGLTIEAKQRASLQTWKPGKKQEGNYFDLFLKKHKNISEDSHIFIQFSPKETGYCWSGPICVSSIGRFFMKFRRSEEMETDGIKTDTLKDGKLKQFASVDIVQENTSFVLHFTKPPKVALPYRVENCLNEASIMYFQKDSDESDMLRPQDSEQYAWDDLSLPRKLVVRIVDTPALREIKIDKISPWKPFLKMRQNSRLNLDFSFSNGLSSGKQGFDDSFGLRVFKIGYEVYADGLTRVLRICEHAENPKAEKVQRPIAQAQFRISYMCIHLLDKGQGDEMLQSPSTILLARFQHLSADSVITDRYKHISVAIYSVNVDEKWDGASFGSVLRMNKLQGDALTESILRIVFVLNSTNSSVKQVHYCSIILQPIDLKVDERTLMKLVPFWRTSLAPTGTPSTQFYFRQFEVHPIKIIASFRPGSPRTSYSSAQEALSALLHSVIKVPEISNSSVELNGVLLNHALVTFRELFLKCAQHYSWYALRAIYVTKGSLLLPPSFASIFDDSASSVLDVFFDPSDGSLNLPGLTIGMFKFISKNMKSGGTKRYLGDLGKTVKTASSNALFAAITEVSDNVVRGAETNGLNGMVTGFHKGLLRLAMEPSVLGQAIMEGGPDRKIKLDHSAGLDELYIEGYLQAMLDVMYKQEYLRVRVVDDQVFLKNLPPNSALINEIVENVKGFLVSKALLKGDANTVRSWRRLRNEPEWKIAPTVLTLCEHLFVGFAVRVLHREASKAIAEITSKVKQPSTGGEDEGESSSGGGALVKRSRLWSVGRFAASGVVAYVDGRLCRHIPNPIARRIVSGFLLSFIDRRNDG
uniref:Uncharacterized protein n=1 Tax=Avena sativa TaxID=4498 RepID=A0ACD6A2G5_AVESA